MRKRRRVRQAVVVSSLVLPVVALLWVPSYAVAEPRLAGLPFFYWYQLAWIPLSIIAMLIATVLLTRADKATARRPHARLSDARPFDARRSDVR